MKNEKHTLMRDFYTKADALATYAHAYNAPPELIAKETKEVHQGRIETIEDIEKDYPDETEEMRCEFHGPMLAAYWIGIDTANILAASVGEHIRKTGSPPTAFPHEYVSNEYIMAMTGWIDERLEIEYDSQNNQTLDS